MTTIASRELLSQTEQNPFFLFNVMKEGTLHDTIYSHKLYTYGSFQIFLPSRLIHKYPTFGRKQINNFSSSNNISFA